MTSDIEIGSERWLQMRREYITATDMPTIMGVNKWKGVKELYLEKTGKVIPFQNDAMKRGLKLEPEARKIFETRFATSLAPGFVISPDYPWAAATLDGWDKESMLVEIKCPGKEDHIAACDGKVPKHYYPQLQWQMMVTSFEEMYYFSYRPEDVNPHATIKVKRDDDYISKMLEQAEVFYQCVQNRIPPSETLSSGEPTLLEDDYALLLEKELNHLLSRRREEDERIEYIKQELLKMCKGKKSQGRFLRFTPIESKGAIQYEKIPQLQSVDVEIYRKPPFLKWRIDQLHTED